MHQRQVQHTKAGICLTLKYRFIYHLVIQQPLVDAEWQSCQWCVQKQRPEMQALPQTLGCEALCSTVTA